MSLTYDYYDPDDDDDEYEMCPDCLEFIYMCVCGDEEEENL